MPDLNTSFNGQTLVVPGAYYSDNVSAALVPTQPPTPPIIFVGYAYGQQPQVPVTYFNGTQLIQAMRGGPASAYVSFMYNPSPQLNGAQQVTFINVGENTQSTFGVTTTTGIVVVPSTSGLTLTSVNYGLPSNLLAISITSGASGGRAPGSISLTLYDNYANTSITGNGLDVPFEIGYLGAATGVSYTVSGSVGTSSGTINGVTVWYSSGATNFITTSPTSGESLNISLSNYSTIAQLVEYLNGTGIYYATTLGGLGAMPSSVLDVSGQSTIGIGSSASAAINVKAELGGPQWWINTFAGNYCTCSFTTSAVISVRDTNLNPIAETAFSGATSVPPVTADYASGFNIALAIPGWAVFADSNSSAIISLGTQHAITASGPLNNNKARRFFTGSSVGASATVAVGTAQAQDSIRTTYCFPGIYANDPSTGINTLYSGLYVAAMVAGMVTGNPPNIALTNKALNGTGTELTLTTSQIDQLQQGGVLPIWVSPITRVPTIISDFTTWQLDANPENVFNQQVACRDYLTYSIVNALNPYVGSIANPYTETTILNAVKQVLNGLLYNSGSANGILVSWNPATLQLVYTGANQLAAVSVQVTFVGQNRFITATVNVQPLNIVIAAGSGPT